MGYFPAVVNHEFNHGLQLTITIVRSTSLAIWDIFQQLLTTNSATVYSCMTITIVRSTSLAVWDIFQQLLTTNLAMVYGLLLLLCAVLA